MAASNQDRNRAAGLVGPLANRQHLMAPMRIFPVLDLMHGQVVRGIAGRRSEYRPLQSSLTDSAHPQAVARAIRVHFRLSDLYLADLDAIAGQPPAIDIFTALQAEGFTLLIDAGLRTT